MASVSSQILQIGADVPDHLEAQNICKKMVPKSWGIAYVFTGYEYDAVVPYQ